MAYSIKRGKGNPRAIARKIRHQRVRKHISGTPERPRLVVTRSNRHMVAQVVDDTIGHTLCAASTLEEAAKGVEGHKVGAAHKVGELIAERAGTRERVAEITSRAMNGELDFAESLRERVATLRGVPDSVFGDVLATITTTKGARALIDAVHAVGGHFGVVSGGFEEVVARPPSALTSTPRTGWRSRTAFSRAACWGVS